MTACRNWQDPPAAHLPPPPHTHIAHTEQSIQPANNISRGHKSICHLQFITFCFDASNQPKCTHTDARRRTKGIDKTENESEFFPAFPFRHLLVARRHSGKAKENGMWNIEIASGTAYTNIRNVSVFLCSGPCRYNVPATKHTKEKCNFLDVAIFGISSERYTTADCSCVYTRPGARPVIATLRHDWIVLIFIITFFCHWLLFVSFLLFLLHFFFFINFSLLQRHWLRPSLTKARVGTEQRRRREKKRPNKHIKKEWKKEIKYFLISTTTYIVHTYFRCGHNNYTQKVNVAGRCVFVARFSIVDVRRRGIFLLCVVCSFRLYFLFCCATHCSLIINDFTGAKYCVCVWVFAVYPVVCVFCVDFHQTNVWKTWIRNIVNARLISLLNKIRKCLLNGNCQNETD